MDTLGLFGSRSVMPAAIYRRRAISNFGLAMTSVPGDDLSLLASPM